MSDFTTSRPARNRAYGTRLKRLGIVAVGAAALALSAAGSATAAGGDSVYAQWEGNAGAGLVSAPGVDFPLGTVVTDSTRLQVPTGRSTFLNEFTPFGAEYGSSRDQQYLVFGTAAGRKPSTTTITFDSAAPAGRWAFALGDIDADQAQISAVGANGARLTSAQLGWQEAFNYCAPSPRPSTCAGSDGRDLPTWYPGSATLQGNVADTEGASGWFRPTVAVKSLTITFSAQSGIPIGQLWIAASSCP
jgi:hypothetical protein